MIGQILNHRYRVTEQIGTGGMAHVYLAVNLTTRKQVAIKVLKEEYKDNPEFLRRFEREARAVLHLSHENVVRAYGVGEENGLPFLIMEYVEGQTLKALIREEGVLQPRAAIEYAYQVLKGLSAAHDAGIIHRDIKPQNVIITKGEKAKLADFGIAREAQANTVTYAGSTVLGSVHYLSPEQAKGVPTTVESDLYSTGIMLYEMLCGEVPFSGDNSVTVALKHINEDPEPLIQKNPMIAPALNDVVMRAISKDPKDRYHSAAAMAADLLRAQYDPYGSFARPSEEVPEKTGSKPSVKKKKKKYYVNWIYPISALLLLGVTVLVVVFFMNRRQFQQQKTQMEFVPVLTDRLVEEAQAKAENYGFTFEVLDYEPSETVPYGNVIIQSPDSGTLALPGTVITGIVSLGPDAPTIPRLVGLTPDEARAELEKEGLVLGETSYMISDVSIGYVCQQSPAEGVECQPGDVVNISISSASAETFPMPHLMELTFQESLQLLSQNAFSNIRIRETALQNYPDNYVIAQTPAAEEEVFSETPLELTVNHLSQGKYTADVAFNLDVENSGTLVTVTILESAGGVAFERILLETTLEKGDKVPVSLTARSSAQGLMELRIYANGTFVRSSEFSFAERTE